MMLFPNSYMIPISCFEHLRVLGRKKMRIPLCVVFGPDGARQFTFTELGEVETESLLKTGVSSISNKLLDIPSSAYLGLMHRSVSLQLFGHVSCTGWAILIGLEHGPFDGSEVAESFIKKVYSSIVDAISNPFFVSLRDSAAFNHQFMGFVESHSVMMKFMTSASIVS